MKKAKFRFIQENIDVWPISTMCRALKVTRAGYYAWAKRPISARDARDLELVAKIGAIYEQSRGIYGAPKIHLTLKSQGERTSKKRVARIMADRAWAGTTRSCAKRSSKERRVTKKDSAPDLVKRDFSAQGPNEAWFADITYVRTRQGWLYLALVMDVWSRKIVGWAMDTKMEAALADDALRMAIERRHPVKGCIHHSDHGSQYGSLLLGKTMREYGIRPSMGAIQSPWDNAVTESLMGIIKSECIRSRVFSTREEAALELFEYIEVFYNRMRIHSALGWLSPEQFEKAHLKDRLRAK